jgi:hypothetical protein
LRERLERLRPVLAQAWQGMLRGSVALSRTIPSIATPPVEDAASAAVTAETPPLVMAEDEDTQEVSQDRVEESTEDAEDEVQPS